MGFSRQEYRSGLPFPFPGALSTQESNPGLLHCRETLYQLRHQGSLGWDLRNHIKKQTVPSSPGLMEDVTLSHRDISVFPYRTLSHLSSPLPSPDWKWLQGGDLMYTGNSYDPRVESKASTGEDSRGDSVGIHGKSMWHWTIAYWYFVLEGLHCPTFFMNITEFHLTPLDNSIKWYNQSDWAIDSLGFN